MDQSSDHNDPTNHPFHTPLAGTTAPELGLFCLLRSQVTGLHGRAGSVSLRALLGPGRPHHHVEAGQAQRADAEIAVQNTSSVSLHAPPTHPGYRGKQKKK